MDKVQEKTTILAAFVSGAVSRIKLYESEKSSGEVNAAIDIIIKKKILEIQTAINAYWYETLELINLSTPK